jgi:hypothetical protein
MGFCLKKCLIETNNRNMEPTPDILNLITIDKYLKTMSKKITKYKLLDSKTYIKRKELLSKCISKCDPSKKDEQLKVMIIIAHILRNEEFQKIAKAFLKIKKMI